MLGVRSVRLDCAEVTVALVVTAFDGTDMTWLVMLPKVNQVVIGARTGLA